MTRGLRHGVVTTSYPRRADSYGEAWHGAIAVMRTAPGDATPHEAAAAQCPTDAIAVDAEEPRVDRGRCILCGRCVEICPEVFRFEADVEIGATRRATLVVPNREGDEHEIVAVRRELARRVGRFRRSIHIRHLDAGSDGSDEWEIAALTNPVYDVTRLGIFFTPSPRHADVLLVTGAGARGMQAPLERTHNGVPSPTVIIAAGTDAISGGLIGASYATWGGIGSLIPVDVWVPGSPPSPFSLLHGILLAMGRLQPAEPT